jgi:hypothetical protein
VSISESESSESGFWLEIIDEMEWLSSDIVRPLLVESDELLAIFASIGKNLKKN